MMRGRDPDAVLKRRWWPTVEMLEAGIDVLTEEWDVAAIRDGVVARAEIAEPVFYLFGPFLDPNPRIEPFRHVVEMLADAEKKLFAAEWDAAGCGPRRRVRTMPRVRNRRAGHEGPKRSQNYAVLRVVLEGDQGDVRDALCSEKAGHDADSVRTHRVHGPFRGGAERDRLSLMGRRP